MIFSKVKTFEYVPTFGGNAQDSEPAVFTLKVMDAAEMEEFGATLKEGKVTEIFRKGFVSVRNLKVQGEDGTLVDAVTAEEVFGIPGSFLLIKELADRFIEANVLTAEKKKE